MFASHINHSHGEHSGQLAHKRHLHLILQDGILAEHTDKHFLRPVVVVESKREKIEYCVLFET